jgi:protein-S-isoprenylcysteine O-methyltransferase Ste14
VTVADPSQLSAAELRPAARIGAFLFKHRTWFPVLFLGIPLFAPGHASVASWIVGGTLVVIGEFFRLSGVAAAGAVTRRRSRNVARLVTYGIFSWSRNPLYNGNFLAWMGFVVISGAMWFLPFAVLLFAIEYGFIVRYEEGVLESTFGREYLDYKNCTPRWLPVKPHEPVEGPHDWRQAWRSEVSTLLQYLALTIAFVLKDFVFWLAVGSSGRVVALEDVAVDLDVLLQVRGHVFFGEDRGHRTFGLACTTVDALIGVDVELFRSFIYAVYGTDVYAGSVLRVLAGFGDDVRHSAKNRPVGVYRNRMRERGDYRLAVAV